MNWTNYLIQANLYLVLFYAFYWLILRRETFFSLNRYYLLFTSLVACLIPLIKTTWFTVTAQPVQQRFLDVTATVMSGYASPIKENWVLGDVLTLIYFFGILVLTTRLIYKLVKLSYLLKDNNQPEAFSFFKKIRINSNLPQQSTIEKHEFIHAKQLHSADILFFEVLAIVNWFNPIIYLYKSSIKHIHEYIADEAVLKTEIDKRSYALLLVSKTFGISPHTLTNNFFNQSLIKQRIEMMNKTKSRKTAIIKYGLSAPLFLLALVLSSATISDSKTINKLSESIQPEKKIREILVPAVVSDFIESKSIGKPKQANKSSIDSNLKSRVTKTDSVGKPPSDKSTNLTIKEVSVTAYPSNDTTETRKVFTNVEVLPSFPGGLEAFGKFLGQNLRYPDVAKKVNIQGRVFCQFVVEKDGSLTNINVVRGIGGGCDEEAVRVLAISPKWMPGKQNGEVVRVSYTIPIFFSLIKENSESKSIPPTPIDISSSSKQLFVVDGVVYKGDTDKLNTELKSTGIQSVNILKGESAIKKYGDKGKDGVIEITTKKK